MKFSTSREALLAPLQQIVGVIERRQTLPILGNVLLRLNAGRLELTGTDLEVQLISRVDVDGGGEGSTTVPARKLADIVRLLPDRSSVQVECRQERFHVQSGRSRFTLSTMPAGNYPEFDTGAQDRRFTVPVALLKRAMDKTMFAMAQQDVRYYLNGLLLEIEDETLRTVASDGHRLALFETAVPSLAAGSAQAILPRKGALELSRLLKDEGGDLTVELSSNSVRALMDDLTFSSKLVEGRYAEYRRVLPATTARHVVADRNELKAALTRVAILSNEKYRGVGLFMEPGTLRLRAQNPDREEAEEEIAVDFGGESFNVGFNASYLLDAVGSLESEQAILSFAESNSSCILEETTDRRVRYLVSPMRL